MTDYAMTLYVNGATLASDRALANIRAICDVALPGSYRLRVVDVLTDPLAADDARVIATPTLIRTAPQPTRRVIGDLSDTARVRAVLELPDPQPLS